MATANLERIKKLLGSGVDAEATAKAVGVSPSYISQLMANEEFAAEISTMRSESMLAVTEHDKVLHNIESKLALQLEQVVDFIQKPRDILQALAIVNRTTRRGAPAVNNAPPPTNVVQIIVPQYVAKQFTMSSSNTVIEADGKPLVTMPAHTLLRELAGSKSNGDAYSKVANYLPAANVESGET